MKTSKKAMTLSAGIFVLLIVFSLLANSSLAFEDNSVSAEPVEDNAVCGAPSTNSCGGSCGWDIETCQRNSCGCGCR